MRARARTSIVYLVCIIIGNICMYVYSVYMRACTYIYMYVYIIYMHVCIYRMYNIDNVKYYKSLSVSLKDVTMILINLRYIYIYIYISQGAKYKMIISYELFAVYFCFIRCGPKYREIT